MQNDVPPTTEPLSLRDALEVALEALKLGATQKMRQAAFWHAEQSLKAKKNMTSDQLTTVGPRLEQFLAGYHSGRLGFPRAAPHDERHWQQWLAGWDLQELDFELERLRQEQSK